MSAQISKRMIGSSTRSVARAVLAALVIVSLMWPMAALAHPPGITARVSVSSAGVAGNSSSERSVMSADGRVVAFVSTADDLVSGDTNAAADVFVHDRSAGITERVSVDSRGVEANADSSFFGFFQTPAISADGRFVAFASFASNLVPRDTNNTDDIFVHDRQMRTTVRVSVASNGGQANSDSFFPSLSADGRFVAFASFADNLVAGDTNFANDVFVHDQLTETTERVSVSSTGDQGENSSDRNAISADGRFVAFQSAASNLVPGDTEDFAVDVYLRDRLAGTTEGVSLVLAGPSGIVRHSGSPAISADGRFVAFDSSETNLVPGDANGRRDVFVRDRQTGVIELVSVSSAGGQGDDDSFTPSVSADGSFVGFASVAENLVAGDANFDSDIFVRDRVAGTTERASVSTDGAQTGFEQGSFTPSISADGQVIAFSSEGALVPEDTGFPIDVYVHDERPPADLSVTKSDSPDPVTKGGELTYTVVVMNNGPAQATDVTLIDTLPATVRFLSVTSTTGNCTKADGTITCDLGALNNGDNATVTIVVRPKKVGTVTNTVRVGSLQPDPNQANNTDTEVTMVISH